MSEKSKVIENFFTPSPVVTSPELDTREAEIKNPVYGIDRSRKGSMLAIRKRDGSGKLIPYSHILEIDFTGGKILTLHCSGSVITIEGDKLEPLVDRLARYEVTYLQEGASENPARGPEGESIREIRMKAALEG